jgi:carbamoyl-phosphate synthase large subunit
MTSYQDLLVWQKSFNLTKQVYKFTAKLPDSERFGLISQMQRAAVSIPSNLAEGQQRSSPKEFAQFISIARGSTAELLTQLELASEIYKIDCSDILINADEVGRMLYSLLNKIAK